MTNREGMYKREREDKIKGGGRKRIPTASRTICPGWHGEGCGNEMRWKERSYERPGGEGLAGGAKTVGGAIPLP